VAGGSVTIGDANAAILQMVQSGKFHADQMEIGARAAANFARMTGKSMEESVRVISRLADDPVDALLELNKQYHFLEAEQLDVVESLRKTQGEYAATSEALRLLEDASRERSENLAEHAGW